MNMLGLGFNRTIIKEIKHKQNCGLNQNSGFPKIGPNLNFKMENGRGWKWRL